MNIKKLSFFAFAFLISVNFCTPILGAFLQLEHGFSAAQITGFFAVYSVSVFLFEIPTGILSDRLGEKPSLFLAAVITIVANILLLGGGGIWVFAGEFIYGIGSTFLSGPLESLAYKYCVQESGIDYDAFVSRIFSLEWIGLCFSFLCSYIFSQYVSLNMCFYMTILANVFAALFAFILPHVSQTGTDGNNIRRLLPGFMMDIKNNRQLRVVFLLNILFSALLVSGYQVLQPYLLANNVNQAFNGIIYFVAALFASAGSFLYDKLQTVFHSKKALLAICVLLIILGFGGLALAGNFILIIALICLYRMVWGIASPMYTALINRALRRDDYRNTAFSMISLSSNLCEFIILALFVVMGLEARYDYIVLGVIAVFLVLFVLCFKDQPKYEDENLH